MEELRRDETLTTADIAQADRARDTRSAVMDNRNQAIPDGRREDEIERRPVPGNLQDRSIQKVENKIEDAGPSSSSQLFPEDELHNFRARWDHVQTSFVDEPRKAVEQADTLVANVVKRIAEQFSSERSQLEKQWDRGDSVSTEDL